MTHVVAFHVAPSQEGADRIERACSAFHAENDYLALLDILFRSSELQNAAAQSAVLTDVATDMASLENRVTVIRAPVDPDRVMFSRMLSQIDYLDRRAATDDVAFVDSDMIINASLATVFAEDFDIALSYRNNPEMPINGGVIFVKGGRAAAAARLLRRVCQSYADKFFAQAHWWGDQRALIDVIGHDRFARRTSDRLTVDGVKVRLLPCERYNFSPENELRAIARPLRDKVILHFKGERKRLMPLYWQAHLANRCEFVWQTWWQSLRTRARLRAAA
jgi:hypothetical protein